MKDFFDISDRYTPLIILVVLGLSFILLTVVFRSLVVPAKAIVMNLLSVGAAYGLIVLVFQKGGPAIGESIANLFGFQQVDAIEAWLPLFLFSILFGLSMDYHVFLLSRIREEYDKTGDNSEAVAYGLRTTGGIITGAAIIMVAVFAGLRGRAPHLARADGLRPGRRRVPGRHDRPLDPGALHDAAPRRSQLVPAALAGVAAEGRRRGSRGGRERRSRCPTRPPSWSRRAKRRRNDLRIEARPNREGAQRPPVRRRQHSSFRRGWSKDGGNRHVEAEAITMSEHVPTLDPEVAEDLQSTLVDLIDLALQAKQAHWNVTGSNFRSVHLQLDEMMTEYRAWSDLVAEREVAIGMSADGRAASVAGASVLPAFPDGTVDDRQVVELFVERLETVAGAFRERMNRLGDTDPVSEDILIQILAGIEKQLWMVRTQLG